MDLSAEFQLWVLLNYIWHHQYCSLVDKLDQYGYLEDDVCKQVWEGWKSINKETEQETDGCEYWNLGDYRSHIHLLRDHHLPSVHWSEYYLWKLHKKDWFDQKYCMVLRNCHGCQCFCNFGQLLLHVQGPQISQLIGIAVQKLSSNRCSYHWIDLPISSCLQRSLYLLRIDILQEHFCRYPFPNVHELGHGSCIYLSCNLLKPEDYRASRRIGEKTERKSSGTD